MVEDENDDDDDVNAGSDWEVWRSELTGSVVGVIMSVTAVSVSLSEVTAADNVESVVR